MYLTEINVAPCIELFGQETFVNFCGTRINFHAGSYTLVILSIPYVEFVQKIPVNYNSKIKYLRSRWEVASACVATRV